MTTDRTTVGPPAAGRQTHDEDHPVDDRYRPGEDGELDELAEVFRDGRLSGGAPVVEAYERALAEYFGVTHAVAVNSGSSALHAALHALGAGPGTEVIVPAAAPLPTALPILTAGATPVLVDNLPDSLALDPDDLARVLSPRTRAAIVVPLWGYPVIGNEPAERLLEQAGVPLIEDAAQAHGTRLNDHYAGTFGTIGCFSTHDRKLLSTGEGGFILTNRTDLYEHVESYTRLGHLRSDRHGVNYKLAAPLAAIGLRRLARLDRHLKARRATARGILRAFLESPRLHEFPHHLGGQPNYYNLVLATNSPNTADTDVPRLFAEAGLPSDSLRYGYRPLGKQPLFASYARACPNAERLAATTIQLPVHPGMTPATLRWVTRCVAAIANRKSPWT